MTVRKREGEIVDFDIKKIERVISLAAKRAKEFIPEDLKARVLKFVENDVKKLDEPIDTKDIQVSVEKALMKYNLHGTYNEFHNKCAERNAFILKALPIYEEMDIKLSGKRNDRQNANVDEETFGGKIGEATDIMLKEKALLFMIKERFAKLHRDYKNYIHDLSRWAVGQHNCLSYPIDNITAKTATIKVPKALRVPGGIESFFQIILVHLQSQSQDQFGGVSITHLDWSSVPFVRKTFWKHYKDELESFNLYTNSHIELPVSKEERTEVSIENEKYTKFGTVYESAFKKTVRSIHQACEAFLHNANTLQSRSGNQLPFTSINYGTCTLREGQLVSEEMLNAWEEGIGELGLTPIFPCGIIQLLDGVNTKKGDPNYYLFKRALEVLPKRDYPNFANGDWSVDRAGFEKSQHIKQNVLESLDSETFEKVTHLPFDIQEKLGFHIDDSGQLRMNRHSQPFEIMSTMGCRTYNGFDINFNEDYFLNKVLLPTLETGELPLDQLWSGNQKDGRGNIAPNTIVMPFYAMEAKKKAERAGHPEYIMDYFLDILDTAISNCRDELIDRFNWIAAQPKSVSKYMHCENHTMLGWDEEEGLRSVMKHGTLAIGQLGLAETLQILIGTDQTTDEGMEAAVRIEELFNKRCAEFKEQYRYQEVSESQLLTKMIKKCEEKKGSPLDSSEMKQLESYCKSKYLGLTPAEKLSLKS